MANELRIFYTPGKAVTAQVYGALSSYLHATVALTEVVPGRYVGSVAGSFNDDEDLDVLYFDGTTPIGAESFAYDAAAQVRLGGIQGVLLAKQSIMSRQTNVLPANFHELQIVHGVVNAADILYQGVVAAGARPDLNHLAIATTQINFNPLGALVVNCDDPVNMPPLGQIGSRARVVAVAPPAGMFQPYVLTLDPFWYGPEGVAFMLLRDTPPAKLPSGSGARVVTVTVTAEGVPVPGALVRLSSGPNTFTSQTEASGQATFAVDDGTYTLAITRGGYTYTPSSHTVADNLAIAATLLPLPFLPASAPNLTVAYCTTCDGQGQVQPNVTLRFRKLASGNTGTSYSGGWFEATSDAAGLLQVELVKGARYVGQRGSGTQVEFTTGTDDIFALPETLSGVRGGVQ